MLVPHARGARVPGPRRPATTRRCVLPDHLGSGSPGLGVVAHAKPSGTAGARRVPSTSIARGGRSARTAAPDARDLWKRYQQEAPAYRENSRSTQQGKQLQARALIAFFTASKRVEDLCPNDVAVYSQARRSRKRHQSGRVRRRTVHADLVFLRTVLLVRRMLYPVSRELREVLPGPTEGARRTA